MSEWVELIRGAATLNTAAFATMKEAKDGFKRGLILIAIFSLAVGLIPFGTDVVRGILPQNLAAEKAEAERGVQEFMKWFPAPPQQPGVPSIKENIRLGMNIGFEIAALPTLLPRPIAEFFEALGTWLSLPFASAGGWMFYALLVLGGQAVQGAGDDSPDAGLHFAVRRAAGVEHRGGAARLHTLRRWHTERNSKPGSHGMVYRCLHQRRSRGQRVI